MAKMTMPKQFKLRNGSQTINVRTFSKGVMENACRLANHSDPETVIGAYAASRGEIWMREDAAFDTLIHEIMEYIQCEYGTEVSHEQLSVHAKVMADIMIQNKSKFKAILK